MGDIMRPVPFSELIERIVGEYRTHRSIFGIAAEQFYRDSHKRSISVFTEECSTPIGPAAGPHTQLAQNIIASYLVGGRFIELKTVQVLDELEIEKPCIDARDEGYNTEWSSEYTLPKAWDEYAKAWIILHLLEAVMGERPFKSPSFIFNMSVGYNLEGIKTAKMQTFIDSMIDATRDERFSQYLGELDALIAERPFDGTDWEGGQQYLEGLSAKIRPTISPSTTLSTMHGCPPAEIEAICSYMLSEKQLNTFVKLNPTLLGFETVREILDTLGYDYITIKRESFDNDLQWSDAISMLKRLMALGKSVGRGFGVKLTNTLGSVNDQGMLPGDEMYMSGRALLPISTTVGERLSAEFGGTLPISYSGGATAFTIKALFESGIRPITLATDLLKPGGYTRLVQMAEILEESDAWKMDRIDIDRLTTLARDARSGVYSELEKQFRGIDTIKIDEKLPMWDCYVAPCVVACPIHQAVPEYVQLVGEGRYAEALELIYDTNALPAITGHICDHQCQLHCTRMDYEGAVKIRDMKRVAVENGFTEFKEELWEGPTEKTAIKAAVVGAGPAGLSAAYFLARAGFDTTVYEREMSGGGIVRHVIPGFRLPVEAIESDIEFIKAHGVEFHFGADVQSLDVATLKNQGYRFIFYAIGSEIDNEIPLQGDRSRVRPSLAFLSQFRKDPASLSLGKRVVVVGGGNTAMDGARAAHRVAGVEQVTVIYRRTEHEMPADREEYANAIDDSIDFIFLANPERFDENTLTVRKMALGEPDESGRRRPVPTEETFTIECDTMITAIGEKADTDRLTWYGVPTNDKGWPVVDEESLESLIEDVFVIGDVQSGPSTVVRCIAGGRAAVEAAIDKVLGPDDEEMHDHEDGWQDGEYPFEEVEAEIEEENAYFASLADKKSRILVSKEFGEAGFGEREAERCMECSYICNKCIDVCPNRANVAIDVRNTGLFDDPFQILHLDAFCNECGNCETFCPYDGGPYRKKFTLFNTKEDFDTSTNSGFYAEGPDVLVRLEGRTVACAIDGEGLLEADAEISDEAAALIETVYESYSYLLGYVEQ